MRIRLLFGSPDPRSARVAAMATALEDDAGPQPIACEIVDAAGIVQAAAMRRSDVVLIEEHAGGQDAAEVLSQLRRASPTSRQLLAYEACTNLQLVEWIRHGAAGCLLRSSDPALLAKAVRTVHGGGTWYGRSALLQALRSEIGAVEHEPAEEATKLTQREEDILHLIGHGLTNKEIGRRLEISDNTVKTHLHRIYVKLHQSGRYKAWKSVV